MAAFAASSITKADPMHTGFSAVKSGIVMFTIPFVFAIYPELLLIDQAVIDPNTGLFLDGYTGERNPGWLVFLMARLALALYLVSSALAAYDRKALGMAEVLVRLAIAILILARPMGVYIPSIIAGMAILGLHALRNPIGEPARASL